MAAWNELLNETKAAGSTHDVLRRKYLKRLAQHTKRNCIIYYSGWLQKPNLQAEPAIQLGISDADKNGFMSAIHKMDRSKGLDLILHTPGRRYGRHGVNRRLSPRNVQQKHSGLCSSTRNVGRNDHCAVLPRDLHGEGIKHWPYRSAVRRHRGGQSIAGVRSGAGRDSKPSCKSSRCNSFKRTDLTRQIRTPAFRTHSVRSQRQ